MRTARATALTAAMTSKPRVYSDNSPSRIESATATSASIRPRNRRLISTEQELVATSGTSTPSTSRTVSPIPSKYPSRNTSNPAVKRQGSNGLLGSLGVPAGGKGGSGRSSPVGAFGDILESGWANSWNALQGLASSVLGADVEDEHPGKSPGLGKKVKRPGFKFTNSSETWGPEGLPRRGDAPVGAGTLAERDAMLRARKRAGILESAGEFSGALDDNGNYKRKTSLEERREEDRHDEDEGALVYIHHVQPNDTLAGVVLKYNCQPAVFRKANRLWPNDSIQVRKVVVLPVDACSVKGRPCEPPSAEGVDLLAPTPSMEEPPSNTDTTSPFPNSPFQGDAVSENDDEPPWTHVRWVLLDSSPSAKPTEIARLPRKTLGYFPPRRRKSQLTNSLPSTPPRSSGSHSILPSLSQTLADQTSGGASPPPGISKSGPRTSESSSGGYFPPSTPRTRHRRSESVTEAADRLGWGRGPGGVGTLGKNVNKPGPAQDGLNTWAKKHIPGLVIDDLPSSSALGSETATLGFNDDINHITEGRFRPSGGTVTPSGAGQGLGIENAAAAIEGWVRRLAKGPGTPMFGGTTNAGTGDLIELLDGSSDDGRGMESNSTMTRSTPSTAMGTGRWDTDERLRGRSTGPTKGKKSD